MSDLKAQWQKEVGEWGAEEEALLELDPEYFKKALDLCALPSRKQHLSPKVRELIHIAVDGSVCRLSPKVAGHVRSAIKAGATKEECLEALECSSVLGCHSAVVGVPLMMQAFREAGKMDEKLPPLGDKQLKMKEEFQRKRGYWADLWESVIAFDSELFEAYTAFSSHPWERNALEPKVKEFVYIAIDFETGHLFAPGGLIHLKNAVRYGATPSEIMEVLEICVGKGVDTTLMGAKAIKDALEGK